ncbi:MAG: YkgJ family cysteine cluster protein [Thioploca sp.]|nr:YkgJ family cysteine cluster protein [Thioploca sp.]
MSETVIENKPYKSPIQPTKLSLNDTLQFRCHKDITCFNECCKKIDISLTPYDILRLKKRLSLTSDMFLTQYTVPYEMDAQGMPGVKIRTADDNLICPFLREVGCSVYEDRPSACRYYPLGLLSMRQQDSTTDENAYFLVKEDHCLGHNEPRTLPIKDYRHEQEVDIYDEINREWRQIILKKRSAGPTIGKPTLRSYQFFFLGSYNLDRLRSFVLSQGFSEIYDLDDETLEQLIQDDVTLLRFGFKLLRQVLFGEMTIPLKEDAMQTRVQRRRETNQVDHDNPNSDYQGPLVV